MKSSVICRDPDVMGGASVFCGTRAPVQTLLDYLEAGDTIDEFLAGFPTVTRSQVIAFLEEIRDGLLRSPDEPKNRSILELRGLGKEMWHGVDAAEYVARERDSWDS